MAKVVVEMNCPQCGRQTQYRTGRCEWCGADLFPQHQQTPPAHLPDAVPTPLHQLRLSNIRDLRLGAVMIGAGVVLFWAMLLMFAERMMPHLAGMPDEFRSLFWGLLAVIAVVGGAALLEAPAGPLTLLVIVLVVGTRHHGVSLLPVPAEVWLPFGLGAVAVATVGGFLVRRSRQTRTCGMCGGIMVLRGVQLLPWFYRWQRPFLSLDRWPRRYSYVCTACHRPVHIVR